MENWWFPPIADGKIFDEDVQMIECLNEKSCNQPSYDETGEVATPPREVTCRTGYTGVLCGVCETSKFYIRSGRMCRQCDEYDQYIGKGMHGLLNWVLTGGMLLVVLGWLIYIVAFHNFEIMRGDHRSVVLKIIMSFCQMLSVLGIFKARGTAMFNEIMRQPADLAGGGISGASFLKCSLNSVYPGISQLYVNFTINMLTLPGVAILTGIVILPIGLVKAILRRRRQAMKIGDPPLRKRDWKRCCRRRPTTPWERLKWTESNTKAYYAVWRPCSRLPAVVVFVMFGIYPTLVKSIFAVLRCTNIQGTNYLDDDLARECYVGVHIFVIIVAVFFAVFYLIGLPIIVALLLYGGRHRLNEEQFRMKFSFLYNGYRTDKGMVVAWEAVVMFRKLAITTIPILNEDPYVQVLLALILLVFSYGIHEKFLPFETTLLNMLETVGLFILIATQIISILYLYIDEKARTTGKKDKVLEWVVTLLLGSANSCVFAVMIYGLFQTFVHNHFVATGNRKRFEEQFVRDRNNELEWGDLTVPNPRLEPDLQLKLQAKENFAVLVLPNALESVTGEIVAKGSTVMVDSDTIEAYVRVGCHRGHAVTYFRRADGRGWLVDPNPLTGRQTFDYIGRSVAEHSQARRMRALRFVALAKVVPIQATSSTWPYAVTTGEVIRQKESFLVDRVVQRHAFPGPCRLRRTLTFLRLVDGRGWVVEPSAISGKEHLGAKVVRRVDTEYIARRDEGVESRRYSEYILTRPATVWRDTHLLPGYSSSGAVLSPYQKILVSKRVIVRNVPSHALATLKASKKGSGLSQSRRYSTMRAGSLELDAEIDGGVVRLRENGAHLGHCGTLFSCCSRRNTVTFLELADGSGYILANHPAREGKYATGRPLVRFRQMRDDTFDERGINNARLCYRLVVPADEPIEVLAQPKRSKFGSGGRHSMSLSRQKDATVGAHHRHHRSSIINRFSASAAAPLRILPANTILFTDPNVIENWRGDQFRRLLSPMQGYIDVSNLHHDALDVLAIHDKHHREKACNMLGSGTLQLISMKLGKCDDDRAPSFVCRGRRWIYQVPTELHVHDPEDESQEKHRYDQIHQTKRQQGCYTLNVPDILINGHARRSKNPNAGPLKPGSYIVADRRIHHKYLVSKMSGSPRRWASFVQIEHVLEDAAALYAWVHGVSKVATGAAPENEREISQSYKLSLENGEGVEAKQSTLRNDGDGDAMDDEHREEMINHAAEVTAGESHHGEWILTRSVLTGKELVKFIQIYDPPFEGSKKQHSTIVVPKQPAKSEKSTRKLLGNDDDEEDDHGIVTASNPMNLDERMSRDGRNVDDDEVLVVGSNNAVGPHDDDDDAAAIIAERIDNNAPFRNVSGMSRENEDFPADPLMLRASNSRRL
jgi:hypothetical protein